MTHAVTLEGTGLGFTVADGESMLAAALAANIHLAHDCKSGTCGTCRFRLLAGRIAYNEPPMGLSPEEEAEGYALACQAHPTTDIVAEAEILPALLAEPSRHSAVVRSVEPLSPSVSRLVLEVPDGAATGFLPGQYANILLGDDRKRSFSVASAPNGNILDFHIRRIPGGVFTEGRLGSLVPGETLDVELPQGSFYLRKGDFRPLLMVATGTGLAPVKSILESLLDDPDCPPVTLYWGMRTADDLYLHEEIQTWQARLCEFRYVPVLSRPAGEWAGRTGYVQDAAAADIEDFSEYAVYLCGSPDMVMAAKGAFIGKGASPNHIYSDSFFFQHNLKGR